MVNDGLIRSKVKLISSVCARWLSETRGFSLGQKKIVVIFNGYLKRNSKRKSKTEVLVYTFLEPLIGKSAYSFIGTVTRLLNWPVDSFICMMTNMGFYGFAFKYCLHIGGMSRNLPFVY